MPRMAGLLPKTGEFEGVQRAPVGRGVRSGWAKKRAPASVAALGPSRADQGRFGALAKALRIAALPPGAIKKTYMRVEVGERRLVVAKVVHPRERWVVVFERPDQTP